MTTSLKSLQQHFKAYLIKGEDHLLTKQVAETNQRFQADKRLSVYREAYWLRLQDLIGSDYPVLKRFLGEQKCSELINDYIRTMPKEPIARYIGWKFPAFLRQHHPQFTAISGLAALENALTRVLFAEPAPVLSMDLLKSIDQQQWPHLVFFLHPHLQAIQCDPIVPGLWYYLKAIKHPSAVTAQQADRARKACKKNQACVTVVVWESQGQGYFSALDPLATMLFEGIRQAQSFEQLCGTLSLHFKAMPQVAEFIALHVQTWIQYGWFSRFECLEQPYFQ